MATAPVAHRRWTLASAAVALAVLAGTGVGLARSTATELAVPADGVAVERGATLAVRAPASRSETPSADDVAPSPAADEAAVQLREVEHPRPSDTTSAPAVRRHVAFVPVRQRPAVAAPVAAPTPERAPAVSPTPSAETAPAVHPSPATPKPVAAPPVPAVELGY